MPFIGQRLLHIMDMAIFTQRELRMFITEMDIIRRIDHAEIPLEDFAITEMDMSMEEALDLRLREEMLLREAEGVYLQWDELSDQRLIGALMVLREDERKMIYQHVFEERTFEEMSLMSGLSVQRVKGIYYYAIRKIRKMMGGN